MMDYLDRYWFKATTRTTNSETYTGQSSKRSATSGHTAYKFRLASIYLMIWRRLLKNHRGISKISTNSTRVLYTL